MRHPLACAAAALFLLIPLGAAGRSDKHSFNQYSVENGLSHSTINTIIQDRAGFMWFGTKDGLNRFDGISFKRYGHAQILSLHERPDGAIWVGATDGVYIFDTVEETFTKFDTCTSDGRRVQGEVLRIVSPSDSIIWIASFPEGLYCYNSRKNNLKLFRINPGPPINEDIIPSPEDPAFTLIPEETSVRINDISFALGQICLATANGLCVFNPDSGSGEWISFKGLSSRPEAFCLLPFPKERLLCGSAGGGIFIFDPIAGTLTPFASDPDEEMVVKAMTPVGEDEIWIGTESGLRIFNRWDRSMERMTMNLSDPVSLSDNSINAIIEDYEGGVWLGTARGGVNYTSTEQNFISQYTPSNDPLCLHANSIREMAQAPDGNLWIGTEDAGLVYFNRSSGTFESMEAVPNSNITCLFLDNDSGMLYLGIHNHGVHVLNPATGMISPATRAAGRDQDEVLSIFKTAEGAFWVGTENGLFILDQENGTMTKVEEDFPEAIVYDIAQDRHGNLWFASHNMGLLCKKKNTGRWRRFRHFPDRNSLSDDRAISVMEDSHGEIWVGTEGGGACRFNPREETFQVIRDTNGLPNDIVYRIIEDGMGNIWFSTNKGLCRFAPKTGTFITYTHNYGVPSDQCNYKSGLMTSDGMLYFGTIRGFVEVNPRGINTNHTPPKVVFTGYSLGEGEHALPSAPSIEPGLKLRHDNSRISIRFAALSYTAPQDNKYAWRLSGSGRMWTYTTSTTINFPKISPGKYLLEVKGARGDGAWSDPPTTLRIVVRPPFHSSWAGICLEVFLGALVISIILLDWRRRIKEKNRLEIERIKKAEALATQKSRLDFFTSIIHEIRTPLSLIKAPFEQLKRGGLSPSESQEDMDTIEANIDRLMLLSGEILDFSKTEENAFTLRPKVTDVNSVVEEVIRNFSFAFKENGYAIQVNVPPEKVVAMADPEILIKILTNLLGNAVKYSLSRIIVSMEDLGSEIHFRVSSDGNRIAAADREKVFIPFWRKDRNDLTSGTGLGLPLVKRLAMLHGGDVWIDDGPEVEGLNTFIVRIAKQGDSMAAYHIPDTEDLPHEGEDPSKRTVAVVDDDTGIRQYLKRSLSKDYNVIACSGGKELFEALSRCIIDLIITDIMMPDIDGITLCNTLKTSFEYSHIPIILLSAKVDKDSKLEGLDANCDAFIEKPFTLDYILGQIGNIFSRLDKMREHFAASPGLGSHLPGGSASDQEFLDKINAIISDHMAEEDFSIDALAEALSMSRSTLYRKIRGVTQIPPNELIKIVRLKKAAELLSDSNLRISEVAFMVGYNSVSYFSTSFRNQFGISPKEFRNR